MRDLESVLGELSELLVIVDEHEAVVACRGSSQAIWGLSCDTLLGLPLPTSTGVVTLQRPDGTTIAPHDNPVARATRTHQPEVAPVVVINRADGWQSCARVVAIPLPEVDGTGGRHVVSVWTDLTAVVERDRMRALRAELESGFRVETADLLTTIEELEAFSYAASHDLRSPLLAIGTMADALWLELEQQLMPEQLALLDAIRETTGRMGRTIEGLLEFSAAAHGEPDHVALDLTAMAREELARLAASDPGRRLRASVADGLAASGDRVLIGIVLHNLLQNAWKFTSRTANARIAVDALDAGGERRFFVSDNGVGFDASEADRVFQPFHRLDSARAFGGSGIGLATVRRIITRHGGRVWPEAAPNHGATFFFTLPAAPTQP